MASTLRSCAVEMLRICWGLRAQSGIISSFKRSGLVLPPIQRHQSSQTVIVRTSVVPETSLSKPPWPKGNYVSPEEEQRQHAALVQKVNSLLSKEESGRLFAVVHFASRQWKVTNEDLILIENHIEAECGDRIRMEKVLMVGGEDFTLIGRPIVGKDLVRVEATVIEKTESLPKVVMRFWRRHRFQHKRMVITPQTVLRINSIEVAPRLT